MRGILRTIALAGIAAVLPGHGAAGQAAPARGELAAGDTIPSFEAEGLDGELREIAFDDGPTVLLFFLSSCPTCHKMIPEWNQAFDRKPDGVRVVGVLLDREPPGFFMSMPVHFPVVRSPSRSFAAELGISRVPFTVRVGLEGTVENAARGLLDPISLGEFFRP